MAKSTKHKNLTPTFSGGNFMASDVQSKFSGLEADSKRRRMMASKATLEGLPSPATIWSQLTGLPMDVATSTTTLPEGMRLSKTLPDTNIGFKLLKKSGWKEGSGLGISEQGRLNPLEPQLKSDRRGIGAKKDRKQSIRGTAEQEPLNEEDLKTAKKTSKKEKNLSKKAIKMKAEEERMYQQAFERQFYREFWPENL